jgi:phosphopantetheine adenylyltransferase
MADIFHAGHARLISQGSKLGKVTVGLLSDNACLELGETPLLDFEGVFKPKYLNDKNNTLFPF